MRLVQSRPPLSLLAFRVLATLSLAGIVMQFFLAGMTVFGAGSGWEAHSATGGAVGLPILGLFLVTFLSGMAVYRALASLLVLLYLLQLMLAGLGDSLPLLGALHPVNGLLLGLVATKLTLRGLSRPFGSPV